MPHRPMLTRLFALILGLGACVTALAQTPTTNPEVGRQVIFAAEHEGGLHSVDLKSLATREIKIGLPNTGDLAYSSALGMLVLGGSRDHDEPRSLYLLNIKSNKKQQIFNARTNKDPLYRPKFDPQSEHVYALNYSTGIFKYSLKTEKWAPVKVSGVTALNPQGLAFSASGAWIAISPGDFKGFLIAKVESNELRFERLVLSEFDNCTSPQWIGEDALVFAGRKQPGLQHLWKLNLRSGEIRQLTNEPIGARDFLSLSSNDKDIVFTATKTDSKFEWRLWTLSLDGGSPTQITKGGHLSSHLFPVWKD